MYNLRMIKIAIIEIGTNSVKLLIAEISGADKVFPIYENVVITRIGRNLVTTKCLDTNGARQTIKLIKEFLLQCKQQNITEISILGTSALREATNRQLFIRQVKKATGLDIEIISPRQEAYLSYLGAIGLNLFSRFMKNLVIDIGGGSTELAYGYSKKIKNAWNIPIGAVKLTEKFAKSDPISDKEYQQMVKHIKTKLANIASNGVNKPFITYGVGGTVTTLAAVDLGLAKVVPDKIQDYTLTRAKVNKLLNLFLKSNLAQREKIKGLEKDRADIILAGTSILLCLMDLLNIKYLHVSPRGLRYGYLINKFSPHT